MRSLAALLLLSAGAALAGPFAPLDQWKAAVLAADRSALTALYNGAEHGEDVGYWVTLKASGVSAVHLKVLDIANVAGGKRALWRVEATQDGRPVVAQVVQMWALLADGWRIVAVRRTPFAPDPARRLPQPATPNPKLYPDPSMAKADLSAASKAAARDQKRVLVVFGGNWCYDCHVLDATFHSPDFAPLVESNFVVVHISIGSEGKDNADIAEEMGVALDKGVPSLAVLEADGTVVVAQRGGEFESTVKIGPDDIRAFLEKWKPARK